MNIPQFTHPEGHLDIFQFGAIMNSNAMKTNSHLVVNICMDVVYVSILYV